MLALLKSSTNADEWNENCDKIKSENAGNYPEWWWSEVILSGLIVSTLGEGSDKITFNRP